MKNTKFLWIVFFVEVITCTTNPWPTSYHDSQSSNRANISDFSGYFELAPFPQYFTPGLSPFMASSEHLLIVERGDVFTSGECFLKLLNITSFEITSTWTFMNGDSYNQLFSLGANLDGTRFYSYFQDGHNRTLYGMSPTGTIVWSQSLVDQMFADTARYGVLRDEIHFISSTYYTKWQGSTGAVMFNVALPRITVFDSFVQLNEISGITCVLSKVCITKIHHS